MRLKDLSVLLALPVLFVSCSGGGGSGSVSGSAISTPGATIQSQFVDSPVKGLKYTIGLDSGYTGDNGYFSCKNGETVTFSVKDKVIGSATCGEKIYISDMILPNDLSVGDIDYAASLIQSLSKTINGMLDLSDFNSSNISLSSIDLRTENDTNSTIQAALTGNAIGLDPVLVASASIHVLSNLPNLADDSVMADLAQATTAGVWVTLNKTAGDETYCWDKISAKIQLQEETPNTGVKNYRFKVLSALGHDLEANVSDPGAECDSPGEFAECYPSPVQPRYMTGRKMSFTTYSSGIESIDRASYQVCGSTDNYFITDIGEICDNGLEPLSLDKDYINNWNEGYNIGLTVTDTGYSLSYYENGTGVVPNPSSVSGTTISLMRISGSCSYSATGSF